MKGKHLFYAVSGRGCGNIYTDMPVRNNHFKVWEGHIEGCISSTACLMAAEGLLSLPPLTWDDEPLELELTISVLT